MNPFCCASARLQSKSGAWRYSAVVITFALFFTSSETFAKGNKRLPINGQAINDRGPHSVVHHRGPAVPNVAAVPRQTNQNRVMIEPCCSVVPTGPENVNRNFEIVKDSEDQDPYTTGPAKLERRPFLVSRGVDYSYQPPAYLGNAEQIPGQLVYEIEPQSTSENINQYNFRRLKEVLNLERGTRIGDIATEVGHGAQSHVFMIHPKVPGESELVRLYPSENNVKKRHPEVPLKLARRLIWASEHSDEVIKVRTPSPWDTTLLDAARHARRDVALTEVLEACAERFTIFENGVSKPLVQVLHYKNDHHEMQHGIFRQPTVNGDTAYKIAAQIAQARRGNANSALYLTEQMKFRSIEDAERKIRLLEAFYAETHFDIIRFESENRMPIMAGHLRRPQIGGRNAVTVGFDYNMGQNAMWDPAAQVFKVIDF